jgi:hypothetical protein
MRVGWPQTSTSLKNNRRILGVGVGAATEGIMSLRGRRLRRDGFDDAAPDDDFTWSAHTKSGEEFRWHGVLIYLRAFGRPDAHEVAFRALAGAVIGARRQRRPAWVGRGVGFGQLTDGHPPLICFSGGWWLPLFELNRSLPL